MKSRLTKVFGIFAMMFICLSFVVPKLVEDHPLMRVIQDGLTNWDELEMNMSNSDFNSETGLDVGIRYKYAILRNLLSIEKLGDLVGEPVFLEGGPHGKEINYNDEENFGHYNPAFLSQAKEILEQANQNAAFHAIAQQVYDSKLKSMARSFYRGHEYVKQEGSDLDDYTFADRFHVFNAYSDLEDVEGYDLYEAFVIPGFWVRRKEDGTADAFFDLLNMMLNTYDAEYLEGEPLTNPLLHKIGQGMIGWRSLVYYGNQNLNYDDDGTTVEVGLRYNYAMLKGILNIRTLERLTGEKVFKKGPHGETLDYDADEFGHYNVVFLERMKGFLYGAMNSKIFTKLAQPFYDDQLKGMMRDYYNAYQFIQKEDNIVEKYGTYYNRTACNEFAYAAEKDGFDWFNSNTALGFWGRRTADGTAGYFLQIIETVMDKYDPGYRN